MPLVEVKKVPLIMNFKLPPLPYEFDSLAPVISAETLRIHHGKHHQSYIDKLNELLPGSGFENASLETIIKESDGELYNQAAQAWNHEFYWLGLAPPEKCHPIDHWPRLQAALESDFGSTSSFVGEFKKAAMAVFGSGWVWLVQNPSTQKLSILSTSNAETPLRQGLTPLWACDVWEHAYYIDYRNERKKYLENIWGITSWKLAEEKLRTNEKPAMTGLLGKDQRDENETRGTA